jgi:hypothetical protein
MYRLTFRSVCNVRDETRPSSAAFWTLNKSFVDCSYTFDSLWPINCENRWLTDFMTSDAHWSLVTGHWSLVTGHWSLVTGHWALGTGHWALFFTVNCELWRRTTRIGIHCSTGVMTVFVWSIREYWPTVDLRLVGRRSRRSDLTGEEANLTDRPALGEGVLKK